jgi:hypothetical protein
MLIGCFNHNSRSWGKPVFILPKSKEGDRGSSQLPSSMLMQQASVLVKS